MMINQQQKVPCILVMAGGTGGHIFPALAVAGELRQRGWRIVWLGNPDKMEGTLVPRHQFDLYPLAFSALRGKGIMAKLMLPVRLMQSLHQTWRAFSTIKPDIVIGFGGYISFPGGVIAFLRGIPLVIHEANAIAGLANKVLSVLAKRVLCGFPHTLSRAVWTGNPVRPEFAQVLPAVQRYFARGQERIQVLVLGGSLGAAALNEIIPKGLALIPPENRPKVIHQSGQSQIETLKANYQAAGVDAECLAFIDNMPAFYAQADIVICRSGALTVAELAATGVASVLIPFPFAVDDHQRVNAQYLVSAGAAFLMPQDTLTPELIANLSRLQRPQLAKMAEIAGSLGRLDATRVVADICVELFRISHKDITDKKDKKP